MRLRARPSLPASLSIALASGLLVSAAFPPIGWWPVAFVALTPFLWLLRWSSSRRGAALGFAFGVGCYGATLYWILLFGEMAWVSLVLLCSASAVVFGLGAPTLSRRGHPILQVAALAALWTAVDWIRTSWPLGGFSWGSLGVSQVDNRFTVRLATVAGVWGVTFVVVAVNALLVETVAGDGGAGRRLAGVGVAALLVAAPVLIPFAAAVTACSAPPSIVYRSTRRRATAHRCTVSAARVASAARRSVAVCDAPIQTSQSAT